MRETANTMEWWREHANVLELARWLDARCEFSSVSDAIRFFDEPWHWDAEYEAMRAQGVAEAA